MAIEAIIYSWKQTCSKHQQLHIKLRIMTCNFLFHNEGKKHISSRCEGFVVLEIPLRQMFRAGRLQD